MALNNDNSDRDKKQLALLLHQYVLTYGSKVKDEADMFRMDNINLGQSTLCDLIAGKPGIRTKIKSGHGIQTLYSFLDQGPRGECCEFNTNTGKYLTDEGSFGFSVMNTKLADKGIDEINEPLETLQNKLYIKNMKELSLSKQTFPNIKKSRSMPIAKELSLIKQQASHQEKFQSVYLEYWGIQEFYGHALGLIATKLFYQQKIKQQKEVKSGNS